MRCRACNVLLTDEEATRKEEDGDYFIDLCFQCDPSPDEVVSIGVPFEEEEIEDEENGDE